MSKVLQWDRCRNLPSSSIPGQLASSQARWLDATHKHKGHDKHGVAPNRPPPLHEERALLAMPALCDRGEPLPKVDGRINALPPPCPNAGPGLSGARREGRKHLLLAFAERRVLLPQEVVAPNRVVVGIPTHDAGPEARRRRGCERGEVGAGRGGEHGRDGGGVGEDGERGYGERDLDGGALRAGLEDGGTGGRVGGRIRPGGGGGRRAELGVGLALGSAGVSGVRPRARAGSALLAVGQGELMALRRAGCGERDGSWARARAGFDGRARCRPRSWRHGKRGRGAHPRRGDGAARIAEVRRVRVVVERLPVVLETLDAGVQVGMVVVLPFVLCAGGGEGLFVP